MLEEIKELFELTLLERADFSQINLFIMISMFTLDSIPVIVEFKIVAEGEKNNLLTTSLISTTIQDRGKRERSDVML